MTTQGWFIFLFVSLFRKQKDMISGVDLRIFFLLPVFAQYEVF